MEWNCIIANLSLDKSRNIEIKNINPIFLIKESSDFEEIKLLIDITQVANLFIVCDSLNPEIEKIIQHYFTRNGYLPHSVMFICDDPSPGFLIAAHEFNIEQFCSIEQSYFEVVKLMSETKEVLSRKNSLELQIMQVSKLIRVKKDLELETLAPNVLASISHHYLSSYFYGKFLEFKGQYEDATKYFKLSLSLNKLFRPTQSALAEILMINGKLDEALAIFKNLEKANGKNATRKALMASVYLEKKDREAAEKYLNEAFQLDPNSSKANEVKAYMLLLDSKLKEAIVILDHLSDVGPYFASKLNEMGVHYSKNNNTKSALILYQKAHQIVTDELKYKISLNAALACRRIEKYDAALRYLSRCKEEYGNNFEKLNKIEQSIYQAMQNLGNK